MPLGQMQVDGSDFEVAMAEQDLNGAQVGAGFKKMCREAMATGIVVILMICIPRKSAIPYIRTSELK
jgi:hypothetical protein